ncbi:MAG: hypothetical protein M3N46_09785, partial [Actinomycetota bacterium]|nr:hypothetical protein [Actinomycetota bacterium]
MTVCATCSRELQPSWKYCIYCGTRTTVPLTAAIDIIPSEERAVLVEPGAEAVERAGVAGVVAAGAAGVAADAAPVEYDNTDTGVLKIEDIPADDAEAITSLTATPTKIEPKINVLAIIALILGCLISPLAALFGHIALSQIGRSGERGTAIA